MGNTNTDKAELKKARREFADRIASEIDTGYSKGLLISEMKKEGIKEEDVLRAISTLQSQRRVCVDGDWLTLVNGSKSL